MKPDWSQRTIQRLRETVEPVRDAELLGRFVSERNQSAFELLVRRHILMLLGACQRILQDEHDAEDAVQATFLVLARKASSISQRESVAGWLHKVACRIALRLRNTSPGFVLVPAEEPIVNPVENPLQLAARNEIVQIIDEEINRLPEKYRIPVILHELRGQTCRDVARELDCPLGTIATRLSKARELLRKRLTQRGVALSSGLALTAAGVEPAEAATGFVEVTVRAAQTAGTPEVSARVLSLARGAIHSMNPTRNGLVAVLLLVAVFGGSVWLQQSSAVDEKPSPQDAPKPPAVVRNSDWPMFGGTTARNLVNASDRIVTTDFNVTTGKNIKWKAELGSRSYGGPVVAGGRVFVGTNNDNPRAPRVKGDRGVLMCFEVATGRFLWQAVHAKLPAQANDWANMGILSSPTVEGDRLYYVSNRATAVCATTAGKDGKAVMVWEYDMIEQLKVFPHTRSVTSPLVVGDLLFVVTGNGRDERGNLPSPGAPSFLALNKKTGKVVWQDRSPGKNIRRAQWSSPTSGLIGGRQQLLFPGGDGWLRAFEPETGKLLWKFDCNPRNANPNERNEIIAVPVVHEGKVYIGLGQDPENGAGIGWLGCIDPTKPKQIPADGDISAELGIAPAMRPNPNSGLVWSTGGVRGFGRTMSTCAIHDGLVYAAELNGYLHCIDAQTGKTYWSHDLRSMIWGSPLWVAGEILIGTDDGELWIFKHGKQARAPEKINLGSPIRSTPVVANGVLYVMTATMLYAIGGK